MFLLCCYLLCRHQTRWPAAYGAEPFLAGVSWELWLYSWGNVLWKCCTCPLLVLGEGGLEEAALMTLMSAVEEPRFSLFHLKLWLFLKKKRKKKQPQTLKSRLKSLIKAMVGGGLLSISLPGTEGGGGRNAASVFFVWKIKTTQTLLYTNDFLNKHTFEKMLIFFHWECLINACFPESSFHFVSGNSDGSHVPPCTAVLKLMERAEGETVKFDLCIESVHHFG